MKKKVVKIGLLSALTLLGVNQLAMANSTTKIEVVHGDHKTETFKVYGNCGMCEKTIEGSLKNVKGIDKADWNKETKMMVPGPPKTDKNSTKTENKRFPKTNQKTTPKKHEKGIRIPPARVDLEPPLLQTSSLFNRETHATTTSIAGKRFPLSAGPLGPTGCEELP